MAETNSTGKISLLNPYLVFDGQCEAAFKFYEQCLGGEINAMMTHEQMPEGEEVPEGWGNKIMHACLSVGDNTLMGSDAPPSHYAKPTGFAVQITVDDVETAERVFAALGENGTVHMPLEKTFWAARFGMLADQFGTPWMINCYEEA